jgi:uncharacterized membrane protein
VAVEIVTISLLVSCCLLSCYLLIGWVYVGVLWERKQIKENRAKVAEIIGDGPTVLLAGMVGAVMWPVVLLMRTVEKLSKSDHDCPGGCP